MRIVLYFFSKLIKIQNEEDFYFFRLEIALLKSFSGRKQCILLNHRVQFTV